MLNGKRILGKRKRKDNRDNIYKKIKRNFFNNALIDKLSAELRYSECRDYFRKFPPFLTADVTKRRNKEILDIKNMNYLNSKMQKDYLIKNII